MVPGCHRKCPSPTPSKWFRRVIQMQWNFHSPTFCLTQSSLGYWRTPLRDKLYTLFGLLGAQMPHFQTSCNHAHLMLCVAICWFCPITRQSLPGAVLKLLNLRKQPTKVYTEFLFYSSVFTICYYRLITKVEKHLLPKPRVSKTSILITFDPNTRSINTTSLITFSCKFWTSFISINWNTHSLSLSLSRTFQQIGGGIYTHKLKNNETPPVP